MRTGKIGSTDRFLPLWDQTEFLGYRFVKNAWKSKKTVSLSHVFNARKKDVIYKKWVIFGHFLV